MPGEQDIQKLEELVRQTEDYVNRGVWEPRQQEKIVATIAQAEAVFNQIIDEYIAGVNARPVAEAYKVSELQERLHRARHNLPSPPPEQDEGEKKMAKEVIIYTTPT